MIWHVTSSTIRMSVSRLRLDNQAMRIENPFGLEMLLPVDRRTGRQTGTGGWEPSSRLCDVGSRLPGFVKLEWPAYSEGDEYGSNCRRGVGLRPTIAR